MDFTAASPGLPGLETGHRGVYTRASARNSPIETAPALLEINICKILGVTPILPGDLWLSKPPKNSLVQFHVQFSLILLTFDYANEV